MNFPSYSLGIPYTFVPSSFYPVFGYFQTRGISTSGRLPLFEDEDRIVSSQTIKDTEFNSGKKEAFRKEVEWFVDYQNLFQRRLGSNRREV